MLSFNQSALSQYLNGKIPLNIEAATKFATLINCPVEDFSATLAQQAVMHGSAATMEMLQSSARALLPGSRQVAASDEPTQSMTPIKRVSLTLQAGIMGFETAPMFDDGGTLDLPTRWIVENDLVPHCLIAITVKGDSMVPMLYEKDIVVVNIADTKKVSGKVYAINFNGEAVIKRLRYEGHEWYLESENSEHKRRMCRGGDCIVVGRVVRFEPVNFKDRL